MPPGWGQACALGLLAFLLASSGCGGAQTIPAPVYAEQASRRYPDAESRATATAAATGTETGTVDGAAQASAERATGAAAPVEAGSPAGTDVSSSFTSGASVLPPGSAATARRGPQAAGQAPDSPEPLLLDGQDLPIGTGDLLEIAVLQLPELAQVSVRVPHGGSIALPLLGSVPAAGYTATQLQEHIRRRLQERYMYHPVVSVLVVEQQSSEPGLSRAARRQSPYGPTPGSAAPSP